MKTISAGLNRSKTALLLLAIFTLGFCHCPSSARTPSTNQIELTAPGIRDGLDIHISGRTISIAPGSLWINNSLVTIGAGVSFQIPPCPPLSLHNEPFEIHSAPTVLSQLPITERDSRVLTATLIPGSLKVQSHPNDKANLQQGVDYEFDQAAHTLRIIPGGAIKDSQTVFIDCIYSVRRLDTVIVDQTGKVRLATATEARDVSLPLPLKSGELALANIYAEPEGIALKSHDVLPIRSSQLPFTSLNVIAQNRLSLSQTVHKLQSGQPVTIVFWGDSITGGAGASDTGHNFVNLVKVGLLKKFPKAQLTIIDSGVGGSSLTKRIATFSRDVLSKKPDLIVVEFINDIRLSVQALKCYEVIPTKAHEIGADVLMVNPGFPSLAVSGVNGWKQAGSLAYYDFIRELSQEQHTALADVEARWEHIGDEGLSPELLLNDFIHPNDLGHLTYAQTILSCFQ